MKEKKRYNTPKLSPQTVSDIVDAVFEQAETIVSANFFVVDIEMVLENGRWYLRVYLDHPNPAVRVTLDDCKDISEALGEMIEGNVPQLENFSYVLEVSSPGMFRPLKHPRELQFYKGRRVEIQLKGQTAFIAYLSGYNRADNTLTYRAGAEETSESTTIEWDPKQVKIALSPDLSHPVETKTVPRRIERYD